MQSAVIKDRLALGVKTKEAVDLDLDLVDNVLNLAIDYDSIVDEIEASNTAAIAMEPLNLRGAKLIEVDRPKTIATLPDHLILHHILPRLPVKPLLGFKLVCKDWCSTICSPEFAKSQLAFSGSRHQFALLLEDDVLVDNPNYRIFRACFKYDAKDSRLCIIGACNGLVGFSATLSFTDTKLFVLNPATGQRVDIQAPEDDDFKHSVYWFGYVSSLDDYKIVAFNPLKDAFWTYSWKGSGIWERSFCSVNRYERGRVIMKIRYGREPVLINDSLYWPIDVFSGHINVGTEIVELNLVTRVSEVKPRMNFACGKFLSQVKLVNLEGCLGLYTDSTNSRLDVWMLRQIRDWSSWEKVYSMPFKHGVLVYYSSTGKLLISHSKQIKVLDDLSQLPPKEEDDEEDVEGKILYNSLCRHSGVADYVESLISPL